MNNPQRTFRVTRDGSGHWIGRGPNGIHTFAKRLDQLAPRLAEALAAANDTNPPELSSLTLVIDYNKLGLSSTIANCVDTAARLRTELAVLETELAETTQRSVDALHSAGFTVRDIGHLLGVTHQRVHQLKRTSVAAAR